MAITAENALELQLLSAKKRVARNNQKKLARLLMENEIAELDFTDRTLARVRLQLNQVYEQFTNERDPQKLDRLAAAQSRLAEQERVLAGRPMPGSLRPSASKPARRESFDPVASLPGQIEAGNPISQGPQENAPNSPKFSGPFEGIFYG